MLIKKINDFRKMAFCLLLMGGVLGVQSISAQNPADVFAVDIERMSYDSWIQLFDSEAIAIWVQKVDCIDRVNDIDMRKLIYKVTNKTNEFLAVQWDQRLDYGDRVVESTDLKPEYRKRIALRPLEEKIGNCSLANQDLTVFVKMLKPERASSLVQLRVLNISAYR